MMRVAGLFAGIGGIELGLQQAGHEAVLFCENDAAAAAVLRAQFPDVPVHDDIRTLTRLPRGVDLVTAGFPCQDLSQAGRTEGIDGSRSGLVSHLFRLLRDHDAHWVLIENVPFMLQLNRGAAMTYIVENLEALGYRWAYRIIDSRSFGLPQRRRRVYVLASKTDDPAGVLLNESADPPADPPYEGLACGFYWTEGNRGLGWAVNAIPTLKGGSGVGIPSPPAIWLPDGSFVTPDLRDAERLQGFPADWTKRAETVARRSYRWRLVGNAVSVLVAEWLGRRLNRAQGERYATGARPITKWAGAGFGQDGRREDVAVSEWPIHPRPVKLAEFLSHPTASLSAKAAAGFLDRLLSSTLWYPPEFAEALIKHIDGLSGTERRGSNAEALGAIAE